MNKQQKIPKGWKIVELDSLTVNKGLVRGPFGGAIKKEMFVTSGYKVYEQRNAIYASDNLGGYYIDGNKYQELIRFSVKPGDFIVSCSGTIGRIYQIPVNAPEGVINQALLKITVDRSKINDKYFLYQFSWDQFQSKVVVSTQGGAMQNLVGMDIFRKTNFILPPLLEQNRIVQILETWDRYLDLLDKQIKYTKNTKYALAKQLLAYKIRLKRFSGPLIKGKLSDVCTYLNGKSYESEVVKNGKYYLITLNSIDINGKLKSTHKTINSNDGSLNKGDLIMILSDIAHGFFLGLTDVIPENNKYVLNQRIGALKPKKNINSYYLSQLLNTNQSYFKRKGQGSSQQNLSKGDVMGFELQIPSLDEQKEVSDILQNLDQVIELLEKKYSLILSQKKYLLNNLITGQIKVPEFASHN